MCQGRRKKRQQFVHPCCPSPFQAVRVMEIEEKMENSGKTKLLATSRKILGITRGSTRARVPGLKVPGTSTSTGMVNRI